jgi:hypothetical protein
LTLLATANPSIMTKLTTYEAYNSFYKFLAVERCNRILLNLVPDNLSLELSLFDQKMLESESNFLDNSSLDSDKQEDSFVRE